jgi:hypothetical protein
MTFRDIQPTRSPLDVKGERVETARGQDFVQLADQELWTSMFVIFDGPSRVTQVLYWASRSDPVIISERSQ